MGIQNELIDRVNNALIAHNRMQKSLAKAVGISEKHLSQILNAKAWPRPEVWDRLIYEAEEWPKPTNGVERTLPQELNEAYPNLAKLYGDQLDAVQEAWQRARLDHLIHPQRGCKK